MRTARAQDWRRRIYEKPYSLRLNSFVFRRVFGIGSGEIPFRGGVTAICGANGVGKTTLLQALLGALDIATTDNPLLSRLSDTEMEVTLTVNGQEAKRSSSFLGASPVINGYSDVNVIQIDPGAESARLKLLFSDIQDLGELIEPLAAARATESDLKILSYLVGRDYASCHTFEIEDYNGLPTFPYFRVESGPITYGSESMGLGELSLHLMFWQLNRMASKSILLVEEPETHVSPRSQSALLDVLAKFSMEKFLWIILTTHSSGIIANVPLEHIRLMSRQGGTVTVINNPTRSQINTVVGIGHQFLGVLLVEDRCAQEFLRVWLRFHDPEILRWYDLAITGSETNTEAALNFPKINSWFQVVGIFDGDARARVTQEYNWKYVFLPGNLSPENTIRNTGRASAAPIAAELGRSTDEIAFVLAELEGLDPHDWFEEFHKRLAIPYELLMSALFQIWIKVPENLQNSHSAFAELINSLKYREENVELGKTERLVESTSTLVHPVIASAVTLESPATGDLDVLDAPQARDESDS